VTPEQKYEALKARITEWARAGNEGVEPDTEFRLGLQFGQTTVAEALLEFMRGMEE
jgi:hypothetical protein